MPPEFAESGHSGLETPGLPVGLSDEVLGEAFRADVLDRLRSIDCGPRRRQRRLADIGAHNLQRPAGETWGVFRQTDRE